MESVISAINNNPSVVNTLDNESLTNLIAHLNDAYRRGNPLVSDYIYDHVLKSELALRDPDNALLHRVEPEPADALGKTASVRHKKPMLSTENAFNQLSIAKFIERVEKVCKDNGIEQVSYKATAKLDGWAGNDLDGVLATRGDGLKGNNIEHAFERGVLAVGGRNQGAGEIVIKQDYFDEVLAGDFPSSRNFIAGIINSDNPSKLAQKALSDGACHFVAYQQLPAWHGDGEAFLADYEAICTNIQSSCDYDTDGVILEVVEDNAKNILGSTSHHHRWMLAVKLQRETSQRKITDIEWTTGRTGVVTPTIIYEGGMLSGGNLTRATAHNAKNVLEMGIGIGAIAEIIRSGSVIPKCERIIKRAESVVVPENCPSCGSRLVYADPKLMCENHTGCPAQKDNGLLHFFKTMGNVDAFGPKTIQKLTENGFDSLPVIFYMTGTDFQSCGLGQGESARLLSELDRCRQEQVEDWRFLAAFGIPTLGRGDSRKLLEVFPLSAVGNLSTEQVSAIHGFGNITAGKVTDQLRDKWPIISAMLAMGFNLETTVSQGDAPESAIKGKNIVFTGAMESGSRDDLQKQARMLGANVQSSVNAKTDTLVAGSKVGASKMSKVDSLNEKGSRIAVISEDDYLALITKDDKATS